MNTKTRGYTMKYKETIDRKHKTIRVEYYNEKTYLYSEHTYTRKELVKKVKNLIKDFLNGKVKEGTDYDLEEWCNPMVYNLKLLEKVL